MAAIIIPKLNLGFVHIPKTAGTSLSAWLFDVCNKSHLEVVEIYDHPTLDQIQQDRNLKIISVVRNPYDRLVSWYFYLKLKTEMYGFPMILNQDPTINFDSWVKNVPEYVFNKEPMLKHEATKPENMRHTYWFAVSYPQTKWLTKDPDILIRYENLIEDFKQIQEIFDSDIPLYHLKKTDHDPYRSYYDDDIKDIVYDLYKDDFERWNYQKDLTK